MKVLVLGGGMAGLCAACNLVDFEIETTLVESTDMLGGRASSWKDQEGDTIDNALHVFFPHYLNCLNFLAKVGAEKLHWTKGMSVYDQQGRRGDLPMGGGWNRVLQAFNFSTMSKLDQLSMSYAIAAASLMSDLALERSDQITLLEWFRRHGMTARAIDHFRPFGAGLTFLELNQVSAKSLIYWIRSVECKEMFTRPGIGFANGGLGEIYAEPAKRYIEERGGKVELGRRAVSLKVKGNQVKGVEMADGETLTADAYVCALPYYELRFILPEEALDYHYFLNLWRLEEAPSLSVQIWFDRFVTEMTYIAAKMRGIFNCFADLNRIVPRFAQQAHGSMVEFVLTPAHHLVNLPNQRIVDMVLEEFRQIIPEAEEAEVRKWAVVKQRQGIFAQRPGIDRFRPVQRTPYPNLYLCGDYTRTFISAGMENACASANLAVGYLLEDFQDRHVQLFSKPKYFTPYLRAGFYGAAAALSIWKLAARGRKRQ